MCSSNYRGFFGLLLWFFFFFFLLVHYDSLLLTVKILGNRDSNILPVL